MWWSICLDDVTVGQPSLPRTAEHNNNCNFQLWEAIGYKKKSTWKHLSESWIFKCPFSCHSDRLQNDEITEIMSTRNYQKLQITALTDGGGATNLIRLTEWISRMWSPKKGNTIHLSFQLQGGQWGFKMYRPQGIYTDQECSPHPAKSKPFPAMMMMITSYMDDYDPHHDDDRIAHEWCWSS